MTDVTGVVYALRVHSVLCDSIFPENGFPSQCEHWLGMTWKRYETPPCFCTAALLFYSFFKISALSRMNCFSQGPASSFFRAKSMMDSR